MNSSQGESQRLHSLNYAQRKQGYYTNWEIPIIIITIHTSLSGKN